MFNLATWSLFQKRMMKTLNSIFYSRLVNTLTLNNSIHAFECTIRKCSNSRKYRAPIEISRIILTSRTKHEPLPGCVVAVRVEPAVSAQRDLHYFNSYVLNEQIFAEVSSGFLMILLRCYSATSSVLIALNSAPSKISPMHCPRTVSANC